MKALQLLILSFLAAIILSFSPTSKKYIVIDAGHGGNDLGATRNGIHEKDIVLNIAKQIKKSVERNDNYEVVLTRDDDSYPSLSERTEKINKLNPEMVISLHVNQTPKETEKTGFEIYVQKNEQSKNLAEKLKHKLGECPVKEENLHLLRESKVPAILLELGFMSNTKDRAYMSSEEGQKEIAEKISDFIRGN